MTGEDVSIVRAPRTKDRPYFSMCRATAQDERLSWEARGVLAYLLSKPDDWQVQIPDLQQKCGRDKVRGILQELIDGRYLVKHQEHDPETGKFLRNHYQTYETPFTENPSTVEPSTVNPPITYKREKQKTDRHSPKPPKGAGKSSTPKAYPDSYELRKWSDSLISQALAEFDETIQALLMAWGDSDLYPTARNMLKRDQLKYIETARGLIGVGCPSSRFQSLAIYTRATLSWRNNPLIVTDMLGQYSNWLKAQQKRITLETYETPTVDAYPRTDDYLQVDGLGNWIGGSK